MSGLEGRILTLVKNLEEEKRLADKRAKQLYLEGASFVGHGDTPATYVGQAGKFVKVNATPDALVFANIVAGDLPAHAPQAHAASHHSGGGDPLAFASIAGFGTYLDQAVKQASSPTHVTVKLTALTDGYVPYHVDDATGLANSPIFISGVNVGIGKVPSSKLDVFSNVGGVGLFKYGMRVENNPTTNTARTLGAYLQANAHDSSIPSSYMAGIEGRSILTTTVGNDVGTAYGMTFRVENRGGGNLGAATAISAMVSNYTEGTGTITNAYGIKVNINKSTGEITNAYGLFIETIVATNKYGVYQQGAGDKNYFAGDVGIGKIPTEKLDVNGKVLATAYRLGAYELNTLIATNKVSDSAKLNGQLGSYYAATTRKLDDFGVPDDNTDLDATTGRHGLLKKLGGGTANFLRADGAWAAPALGAHAASHHVGGGDLLAFASITGFATYLNQAVRSDSGPTFATLNLTGKLTIGSVTPMLGDMLQVRSNADNAYAVSIENDYVGGWGLFVDIDGSGAGDPIFRCNSGSTARFTVKADGDVEWYCGETGSTANCYHGAGINSVTLRKVSAQRYKDNITDFELDSSVIYNFRPISYKSLCKADVGKGRFHGFIAEEMEQYCPEMIEYDEDNKTIGFDSGVLQTLMLAEIQHHEARIKALEAQLNN